MCSGSNGSFFLHVDYREVHYCKVLLDEIFGSPNRSSTRSCGHTTTAHAPSRGGLPSTTISSGTRRTRRAIRSTMRTWTGFLTWLPGWSALKRPQKERRRRTFGGIRSCRRTGRRRRGIPTQKPLGILERIVKVHSKPGDVVLDFFAGSGTTGAAAAKLERNFILVDSNPEAIRVMAKRLEQYGVEFEGCDDLLQDTETKQRLFSL